jgi:plasmid maintenance system antidote protein VapI
MTTKPYADTRLAKYVAMRINELHHKTQAEIAHEAGFRNANFITMLKVGSSKLALERVPSLAKALDVDPEFLMRLALEQAYGFETSTAIIDLIGDKLTPTEIAWLRLIRANSTAAKSPPSIEALTALIGELRAKGRDSGADCVM